MTLNQIVDSIADSFNRSFDVMFKERIKFTVKYWRATLIKREIDKGNYHDLFFHTIVLPLSNVDIADNCLINVDCPALRTTNKVPTPVRYRGGRSFAFVGSPTGRIKFEYTNLDTLDIKLSGKFRDKATFYDYRNDYIYILNNVKYEYIAIRGVFSDLDKLKSYQCNDGVCYTDDQEFPLPDDLVASMINGMLNNELKIFAKEDKEVDIDVEQRDQD